MTTTSNNNLIANWLAFTQMQSTVANKLEAKLMEKHNYSLNDFYLLMFLSQAPEKKLRLQQLESMIGLSQSAISRLVSRFEARSCGALERISCDEDRRSIYTALTDLGQSKIDSAMVTFNEELAEAFSTEEVRQLLERMMSPNKP
ncbi:MarR family winged helix-turn-helix transcriptional regulator [Paenibacillus agri]|uniref:MarR family transcriptional regulator n=1 Tax=Paenibacillus agri TaxID=2744309 RepID=A0A850EJU2_9BACL|nr:MarR family transcriptional regulator [Paenibacillus agri]NUU59979.1 MarR family transcriptional regulator [Paenibacillus agri]